MCVDYGERRPGEVLAVPGMPNVYFSYTGDDGEMVILRSFLLARLQLICIFKALASGRRSESRKGKEETSILNP